MVVAIKNLQKRFNSLPSSGVGLRGHKYKCVFSVGIYSNSCLLVANHTIFLLFLYALKAEGGALATEC